MTKQNTLRAIVSLAAIFGASHSQATTLLGFQDLSCARSQELCGAGVSYTANGFTLQYAPAAGEPYPTGLFAVGTSWRFNVKGSIALEANSCGATTTLSQNQGKAFAIVSIDLAETNGDSPSSVTFVGTRSDNTLVTRTVVLDGKAGWQRAVFPAQFSQLKSLVWTQGDCTANMPHMFDNIYLR